MSAKKHEKAGIKGDKLSAEQKLSVCKAFSVKAKDVSRYQSLNSAAHEAGQEAVGSTVDYYTIRCRWYKSDDEQIHDEITRGLVSRAEEYAALATQAIDTIEDFWYDEKGSKKERMQAVNKARLKIEHYRSFAALLAPELYGDYINQLRQLESKIKTVEKCLENMALKK